MDIVERLHNVLGARAEHIDLVHEAADEIERLNKQLNATIEAYGEARATMFAPATNAALKKENEALRETIATLNESLTITSQGNAKLKQQVAELLRVLDEAVMDNAGWVALANKALAKELKDKP